MYIQLPRICVGMTRSANVVVADLTSISVSEPEAEEQGVPCVYTIATYLCRNDEVCECRRC